MTVSSFFMPTTNMIGAGAINSIGDQLQGLGSKKVLIVTDAFLSKIGVANRIKKLIEEKGMEAIVFDGAEPNPTDKNVDAGFKVWKKEKCDSLVTLGGGSSHDCGKGIGLLASNGGKIHDYEGIDQSKNPFVPYVAVNTTAGTASEMTRFCIITDTSRKVKMAIVDWRVTAKVSINDPEVMAGMPPGLTAATGMDALTHAVEAYVSTAATPITDAAALMAIELIAEYLPKAVANGDNMVARDRMAYAQFLAGMAFNNASLGYVHAMAHQLGGFYNLPHGVCNAILLPHVEQFNLIGCADKLCDVAVALGENVEGLSTPQAAQRAIDAIKELSASIGIPAGLKDLDVKEKDFEVMAKNAKADACQATNPRTATLEEVIQLFKNAM
ncbi:iron-containing alcohol dehydrogenase [Gudongella sp. DL1XJH-153]|uniref:iron-containing alcohol dehydrogenase n=1 Tax=Gudongella sp. DL1XJH-153 TaxID=3409804 RepID=UPI003BB58C19